MRTLLVIDIDSCNGWRVESGAYSEDKKEVAYALQKTLKQQRAQGLLTIFVVYPSGINLGQEAQISEKEYGGLLSSFKDSIRALAGDGPYCIGCDNRYGYLAQFLEHRHSYLFEPVFLKSDINAFSNKRLLEFIRLQGITELMLAGCFTDCCVLATAQGAVENCLSVELLGDCTYRQLATKDQKEWWLETVKRKVPDLYAETVSVSIR